MIAYNPLGGSTTEISSTSLEQEKYFAALTAVLPSGNSYGSPELDFDPLGSSRSSLDSLALDPMLLWDSPPEGAGRRQGGHSRLSRVVTTFRNSGGKARCKGPDLLLPLSFLVLFLVCFRPSTEWG